MTKIKIFAVLFILAIFNAGQVPKAQALELLMLEQVNCEWCEVWHEEIGPAYPKTALGKKAPLVQLDIHQKIPKKYDGLVLGNYTPTFVLWHQGRELGRLRGYPGEDFFWPMLGQLFKSAATNTPIGAVN